MRWTLVYTDRKTVQLLEVHPQPHPCRSMPSSGGTAHQRRCACGALVLAVATGKLMNEDWLRNAELHHLAYMLHLLAWLLIGLAVLLHVGESLRLGGVPLLASMASTAMRTGDRPGDWPAQVQRWLTRGR